jgi:hypothetical protein
MSYIGVVLLRFRSTESVESWSDCFLLLVVKSVLSAMMGGIVNVEKSKREAKRAKTIK